jgi:hypothetical protein
VAAAAAGVASPSSADAAVLERSLSRQASFGVNRCAAAGVVQP